MNDRDGSARATNDPPAEAGHSGSVVAAATRAVDLTNCDREPIHIPGAILPHGVMLVLDPHDLRILQAAGDTIGLLHTETAALPGRAANTLFSDAQCAHLRHIAAAPLSKPRHMLDPAFRVAPDRPLDASIHRSDGALVLELEAADLDDRFATDPLGCVQEMLDGLDRAPSLQAFCQTAADRVRHATNYDRVMIYRFMDDESGWVFAESRSPLVASFLDLHYPASDIPKQARALYATSWLRLIARVDYDPAPLIPQDNPLTGRPLDMSQATLRDVSPIHREYLRNMGVDASMSISILREGKLWGLIACHHNTPRELPRHLRAICELFGSMFSLQLEGRERAELFDARLASRQVLQVLMRNLAREDDYAQGLIGQSPNLLDYIAAGGQRLCHGPTSGPHADKVAKGGVAVRVNKTVTTIGDTPTHAQIGALTDWLTGYMEGGDGLFATDRLGEIWPPAKAFAQVGSGLLALSVSREPNDFILWFRPEVVETVSWGGDPAKPAQPGPDGDRLTPRRSFAVWKQTVHGRATPWHKSDRDAAFDLRISLLDVVLRRIDAAARARERAHQHERLLMAELDHRVKNTLANIQALVNQTSRSAPSLSEFVTGLEGRIRAMAKAHNLLAESRWEAVSVRSLLAEELAPFDRNGTTVALAGPDAALTPQAALALSLAVHELTTNAAKYGALASPQGCVTTCWTLQDDGGLHLIWTEAGGPPVSPPTRRGFGSTLIERAFSIETGGSAILQYRPGGVVCDMTLPASAVTSLPAHAQAKPAQAALPAATARTSRARILVVEDLRPHSHGAGGNRGRGRLAGCRPRHPAGRRSGAGANRTDRCGASRHESCGRHVMGHCNDVAVPRHPLRVQHRVRCADRAAGTPARRAGREQTVQG